MKTAKKSNISKTIILSALAIMTVASFTYAYPPDNAAVLYYKVSLTYKKAEGQVDKDLADVAKGTLAPSEAMIEYIQSEADTIKTLTDAAKIDKCDWGNDYSEGFELELPLLSNMRNLSRIVLVDANIQLASGNTSAAIDRCKTAYAMARHVGTDEIIISKLVGIAVEALANEVVTKILSQTPPDAKTLATIKVMLKNIQAAGIPMKKCIEMEKKVVLEYTTEKILRDVILAEASPEDLKKLNDESFKQGKTYYETQVNRIIEAFDMPYTKGVAEIENINNQIQKDMEKIPAAVLTNAVLPAIGKCLSLEVRGKTHANAILAAIEVYSAAAANRGMFPLELPESAPKDLFSGKPFKYTLTDAGFTLTCQGKDLSKDKIYDYTFAIAK